MMRAGQELIPCSSSTCFRPSSFQLERKEERQQTVCEQKTIQLPSSAFLLLQISHIMASVEQEIRGNSNPGIPIGTHTGILLNSTWYKIEVEVEEGEKEEEEEQQLLAWTDASNVSLIFSLY